MRSSRFRGERPQARTHRARRRQEHQRDGDNGSTSHCCQSVVKRDSEHRARSDFGAVPFQPYGDRDLRLPLSLGKPCSSARRQRVGFIGRSTSPRHALHRVSLRQRTARADQLLAVSDRYRPTLALANEHPLLKERLHKLGTSPELTGLPRLTASCATISTCRIWPHGEHPQEDLESRSVSPGAFSSASHARQAYLNNLDFS